MSGWLKLVVAVLVIAALAAGYLFLVDRELGRELLGDTPLAPGPSVTTAYKWRDADGNWQLSDRPPPPGTAYETLEADPNANIVPGVTGRKE